MGNRLSVTLITSIAAKHAELPVPAPILHGPAAFVPAPPPPVIQFEAATPSPAPAIEFAVPVVPPTVETLLPNEPAEEEIASEPVTAAVSEVLPPAPVRKEKKPAPPKEPVNASEPPPAPAPAKPATPRKEKFIQARQEVMQFESITRGRFEKSEPTIVEGQDLDVPTYLRKNVRVK